MLEKKRWTALSFTPSHKASVPFRDATVTFPSAASLLGIEPPDDPEDITGPTFIRIHSSSIADIPKLPVGRIGSFRGRWDRTGAWFAAVNAKVMQSEEGDLILEADSLDGVTSPISFTYDFDAGHEAGKS